MISFRPATAKDAYDFYGKPVMDSFKGYVAVKDGAIVGIGGISYMKAGVVAFSEMNPEMKKSKKDIIRAMRIVMEMIKKESRPVYAIADQNEPTAKEFLSRIGFVGTGLTNSEGETLVWEGN